MLGCIVAFTSLHGTKAVYRLSYPPGLCCEMSPPPTLFPVHVRQVHEKTCTTNYWYLQVDGCTVDLSDARTYFKNRRCCPIHMKAASVTVAGNVMRFCAQCCK